MKLPKVYAPNESEPAVYAMWETAGAFRPSGQGEPYSLIMPPPNANGDLHIGHALDMNLKDILARYHRMKGRDVALIPGADHAGFETWVVYERMLTAEGKNRFDFTREQLYSQVWNFVDQKRGNMELQLRALGTGADWDSLVFSLDKKVIDTVYQTFKKLWDDGLIYRGERIVNYCTFHQTSFADIEVEHRDEKGKLWKIAYPTLDTIGEIVIATTRPETLLGDTAVAVHPDDKRYKHLVGTKVMLPLIGREIPVVADEHVDREFGTGAVKVTPAHDPNDYEIAERHGLGVINIISDEGKIVNTPAEYLGLTVDEARKRVLAGLQAEDSLRGEEEILHSVGHCYKCGTIIQPLMKDQWFIRVRTLADQAIARLEAGEITTYPGSKVKELIAYLGQLKDWNISRQIPWGIPIPAFHAVDDEADWIFDERVSDETLTIDGKQYRRDDDTFDTWFSSGQWPYTITDYVSDGPLQRFFPTSVLETGSDLLRQWVARMIMLSVYRTDKIPFREVYFHGMVNDEHNQKMSKSKGNVINPMEIVAEYGSDALRMGIIAGRSPAQAQAFNRGAVIAGRNFCNKLWNVARFIEGQTGDIQKIEKPAPQTLSEHWILSRLESARDAIDRQLSEYRFSEAADTAYHVLWDDVADWYLESNKISPNPQMLAYVLDTVLTLAHPFAPFVTETIWQTLSWHSDAMDMVVLASWPGKFDYSDIAAGEFEQLRALVSEARFIISELPGNDTYRLLYGDDSLVADNRELIKQLIREVKALEPADQARGLRLASSGRDVWLDISDELLYEHQGNLERRLADIHSQIEWLTARLANEAYVAKAPAALVDQSRQELDELKATAERLVNELNVIG